MGESSPSDFNFERSLSASLLRLRTKTPFFATLALFARIEASHHLETAATDGRDIWINPNYWRHLSSSQADGLLLHEVLHAALLHVFRCGPRDPLLWNFAADIVVNGIILNETPFQLPQGHLRDTKLESLSVEEVYEILSRDAEKLPPFCFCDLLNSSPNALEERGLKDIEPERRRLMEAYWRQAREQAIFISSSTQHGITPAGLTRELGELSPARLPWRDYLWRFLVRNPTDFEEFDRRFLSRGLYLEALQGESLQVAVCVDTSGSVDNKQMQSFLSEVTGILRAYPHIECDLFYADAALYGPFPLKADTTIPRPKGGGGTDFRPFFEYIERKNERDQVCVYLTDGYGPFPQQAPHAHILWVVTPGGLDLKQFPFGETVRLLQDEPIS